MGSGLFALLWLRGLLCDFYPLIRLVAQTVTFRTQVERGFGRDWFLHTARYEGGSFWRGWSLRSLVPGVVYIWEGSDVLMGGRGFFATYYARGGLAG